MYVIIVCLRFAFFSNVSTEDSRKCNLAENYFLEHTVLIKY